VLADTIYIVQAGSGRFTRRVKIQNSTSLLEQERHGGGWVGGGGRGCTITQDFSRTCREAYIFERKQEQYVSWLPQTLGWQNINDIDYTGSHVRKKTV
jgi:hypothetical protein